MIKWKKKICIIFKKINYYSFPLGCTRENSHVEQLIFNQLPEKQMHGNWDLWVIHQFIKKQYRFGLNQELKKKKNLLTWSTGFEKLSRGAYEGTEPQTG